MDSNWTLWVIISYYAFFLVLVGFLGPSASILVGFYKSLRVLTDSSGSVWVLISAYAFLLVVMIFVCPYGFHWVLMGP